jgi:hypothetical protein
MDLGSTQPVTEYKYQAEGSSKDGRCVGLTTLSPSCAGCLEILGASTFWRPRGLSMPVQGLIFFNRKISVLYLKHREFHCRHMTFRSVLCVPS